MRHNKLYALLIAIVLTIIGALAWYFLTGDLKQKSSNQSLTSEAAYPDYFKKVTYTNDFFGLTFDYYHAAPVRSTNPNDMMKISPGKTGYNYGDFIEFDAIHVDTANPNATSVNSAGSIFIAAFTSDYSDREVEEESGGDQSLDPKEDEHTTFTTDSGLVGDLTVRSFIPCCSAEDKTRESVTIIKFEVPINKVVGGALFTKATVEFSGETQYRSFIEAAAKSFKTF